MKFNKLPQKKFKKYFKVKYKNNYFKIYKPNNDDNIFGLLVMKSYELRVKHFELCLKLLKKKLKNFKKIVKISFKKYPDFGATRKARDTRMGRGKGNVAYYSCHLQKASVFLTIKHIPEKIALPALELCVKKFPTILKIFKNKKY